MNKKNIKEEINDWPQNLQNTYLGNKGYTILKNELYIKHQFASFILLFLFFYETETISNKFLYIFIYGVLLGIVVSGISYFGIEYFLVKMPEKEVTMEESFNSKEVSTPSAIQVDYDNAVKDSYVNDAKVGQTNTEETSTSFISVFKRILIALIIAIFIFIIYSSLVKKI